MIAPFAIGSVPKILFGSGRLKELPSLARGFGTHLLLVTGHRTFIDSESGLWLDRELAAGGFSVERVSIIGEPSPHDVDGIVATLKAQSIDLVIGIGGGSVLDAAKAIAGLLKPQNSVMDHLEGVGPELPYEGPATPFIAVPTTAGTGSEATRNAVLSRHGADGFKKSFRDDALMARYALIDPDLLKTCPKPLVAANGMDALTQLIEAYVSLRANPMTDALALSGIALASKGLRQWYHGDGEAEGRSAMAYAALQSGICLAQAGLGSVHGLAQPLGSFFPIGHGVVCGTLLAEASAVNLEALHQRSPGDIALSKYAEVGRVLLQRPDLDQDSALSHLIDYLRQLRQELALPGLGTLGVLREDFDRIVAHSRGSSMKTNPILLEDREIATILERCF
jgi:alcohol dehydrogenase class IV